jgi:hypothetical protein
VVRYFIFLVLQTLRQISLKWRGRGVSFSFLGAMLILTLQNCFLYVEVLWGKIYIQNLNAESVGDCGAMYIDRVIDVW